VNKQRTVVNWPLISVVKVVKDVVEEPEETLSEAKAVTDASEELVGTEELGGKESDALAELPL
jgi:hypothetical protein